MQAIIWLFGTLIGVVFIWLAILAKRIEDDANDNLCRNIDRMAKEAETIGKIYAEMYKLKKRIEDLEQNKKGK